MAKSPEKRKYRGIEDLYEAEEEMRQKPVLVPVTPPEPNSLPESNRLVNINSLPESSSPESNSLPKQQPIACQNNSLPESNSLPEINSPPLIEASSTASINLMASLPDVGGFTKFSHQLTDHLYGQLSPAEQVVHFQLFRLSWGYGNSTCKIGLPQLAKRAGIGRSTAQTAIAGLIRKGLISKVQTHFGSDKEQGNEYHVEPPPNMLKSGSLSKSNSLLESGSLPKSGHNKEKNIKKDSKEVSAPPNFQNCPDCHGTGFHYVDELDRAKGVEKCSHAKLKA